jgi:hypothetical protein
MKGNNEIEVVSTRPGVQCFVYGNENGIGSTGSPYSVTMNDPNFPINAPYIVWTDLNLLVCDLTDNNVNSATVIVPMMHDGGDSSDDVILVGDLGTNNLKSGITALKYFS